MMKVIFINRENRKTGFSIEGIFQVVKTFLKDKVQIADFHLDPTKSRLQNIFSVKKLKADIFHITGDVYFLAFGLKGNIVLTLHDLGYYKELKKGSAKFFIYKYAWLYFPFKKAKAIAVVSNYTRDELVRFFPFTQNKISVIHNPVKPVFKYTRKDAPNPVPVILQIGTGPHKNLDNLIEACKGVNVHLDIVAWLDEVLTQKLKKYNISYTVYNSLTDEELYQRYVNCDILFFASFHEGFGMPIIEAQAVGRPVITSNLGAMKEVALDTAVLVNPQNVAEIKNAMQHLISDRSYYDTIVEKGLDNAKRYAPEKVADDYYQLYTSLV